MDKPRKETLFTKQFILLCTSNFLFFASFNMIIPELPAYLSSMGGEDYKGLIIALFTLTAGFSRPFSGRLSDKIGRVPVMLIGGVVCVISSLLYPFFTSVWAFLLLRFFHGFSTGFQPTGQTAYIADIVPAHKRGEAMGIVGFMSSIAMAFGPVIGSELAMRFNIDMMFYVSSAFAFLSVIVIIKMEESLQDKSKFSLDALKITKKDVVEPKVFPAALVWMLCVFSFGVVLTLTPDLSIHLGIANKGAFFGIFTLSSLFVRLLAGRLSDRLGRVKVIKVSCLILFTAMLLLGSATTPLLFYISASLFGLGVGINSPTVMAWLIDLSDERFKGRGIATGFIALEIGIGMGAFSAGLLYNNQSNNFPLAFWFAAFLIFSAFVYLLYNGKSVNRESMRLKTAV